MSINLIIKTWSLGTIILLLLSCNSTKQQLKKAARQTEAGNINGAKETYNKVLAKEPNNYKANLGLGILLSESVEDFGGALPYLTKAENESKKDTVADLIFALGKCYQYSNEFEKAQSYFNRLSRFVSYDDDAYFQKDLKKRKADCDYAIQNFNKNIDANAHAINLGKSINTESPEYVPVITNGNELIFTSKRKDDKQEQINYQDGKYFESMYISKTENGRYSTPRRYTLPDAYMKSKYKKGNESIVSVSADGKILYVYRNNKIYEVDADKRPNIEPKKLSNLINFDYYQNHAYMSADGTQLFFTSESKTGKGDNDIYIATKTTSGDWGNAENIGAPINTEYDEDAPYLSNDGKTLYFASKGHKGFGNFDVYKSQLENGKWSEPLNLGQPINSSGQDIFYIETKDNSCAYYASSKKGGYGDMDIYKIIYLNKIDTACKSNLNTLALATKSVSANEYVTENTISETNAKVLFSQWMVNGEVVSGSTTKINIPTTPNTSYSIKNKTIFICDTCLEHSVVCLNTTFKTETEKDSVVKTPSDIDLSTFKGELSDEQLKQLGFNTTPILFDFDKSNLTTKALTILNTNLEVLKKYPSLTVEIYGHADQRGTVAHNTALSASRANATKNYLVKNKINNKRVTLAKGLGSNKLAVDCNNCSPEEYNQNRRATFRVFNN